MRTRRPAEFTALHRSVKKAEAEKALAAAVKQDGGPKSNGWALQRLCKLWSPFDKRTILMATSAEEKASSLASYWSGTLAAKQVGEVFREPFAAEHVRDLDLGSLRRRQTSWLAQGGRRTLHQVRTAFPSPHGERPALAEASRWRMRATSCSWASRHWQLLFRVWRFACRRTTKREICWAWPAN